MERFQAARRNSNRIVAKAVFAADASTLLPRLGRRKLILARVMGLRDGYNHHTTGNTT